MRHEPHMHLLLSRKAPYLGESLRDILRFLQVGGSAVIQLIPRIDDHAFDAHAKDLGARQIQ
jgi:hypothetical protein